MKNLRIKNWLIIGMMSIGAVGLNEAIASDGTTNPLAGNQLANRKEYKDMKVSLLNIEKDKAKITFYKKELKENRKAELVIAAHMSKKELKKAKADLRHDKKFLKIDKRDLKSDQKVALRSQKQETKVIKKSLRKAKWELQKDLFLGRDSEISEDSQQIGLLLKKLEKKNNETARLERDVDEFFAHLDSEIEASF